MGLLKVIESRGLNRPRGLLKLIESRGLDKPPIDALRQAASGQRMLDGTVADEVTDVIEATNDETGGDLAARFGAALKTGSAVLCRLDVAKAVEESLNDPEVNGDARGETNDDKAVIYQQLLQIVRREFPSPSYCAADRDGKIKMVLFAGQGFDRDSTLLDIQTHLKGALGDAALDVDLADALKSTDAGQIMSFIDGAWQGTGQ